MEIIKRAAAIKQGLTHYYTGKPCKYGHFSLRLTVSAACLTCVRERARETQERFRREHPEANKERLARQYQKRKAKAQGAAE